MVDQPLRDNEAETQDNEEEQSADPALGVLLVHGIGHQKRGETLTWAGDPLFDWLKQWFDRCTDNSGPDKESQSRVYLTDSRQVRAPASDDDPPPSTRVWFRPEDEPWARNSAAAAQHSLQDPNWVVAESFWAEEFAPPSFSELVTWGLGIAPLLVERTGTRVINGLLQTLWDRLKEREKQATSLGRAFLRFQSFVVYISAIITRVLSYLLLFVVGSIAQVFIVALYFLGFFPPARNFVTKTQFFFAGWLGDAYLVAASPVRYNAMVSQIRRDIHWLSTPQRDRGACQAIAVVAHSGGAILAYDALAGPAAEQRVSAQKPSLLITYGSGHSKEETIQQLLKKKGPVMAFFGFVRVGWALVLVALLILSMTGFAQNNKDWEALAVIGLFFLTGQFALLLLAGPIIERLYKTEPFRPTIPAEVDWIDYGAVVDIVTDEPIVLKDEKEPITKEVYNLHSLWDHGVYWNNREEFVPDVVLRLFRKAGQEKLAYEPLGLVTIDEAKVRHRNRVMSLFGAGLISLWSVPLLLFSLGPVVAEIGSPLRTTIVGLLPKAAGENLVLSDQLWNNILGVIVVMVAVYLWHQWVLNRLWGWWTRREEESMFMRKLPVQTGGAYTWIGSLGAAIELLRNREEKFREDPSVEVKSAAAWFLFFSCLLPLITIVIAYLVASYYGFTVATWVLVILSVAVFLSRIMWVSLAWSGLTTKPDEEAAREASTRASRALEETGGTAR